MLHVITSVQDPFIGLIQQDPVRPHIPAHDRVSSNGRVLVLMNDQHQLLSVLCVAFSDHVVTEESDLFSYTGTEASMAMLYTIWSLARGGGVAMIHEARDWIRLAVPTVQRMITLSPPTLMARKFHLGNGAWELQVNAHTVNFEYALH